MADVSWLKIKNEYLSTNISYRKLADKWGVSFNTLKDRATREKWGEMRANQHHKITTNTQQKIIKKEVDRIDRLYSLSDRLGDKLEQAISELDIAIVTNKHKTRTIEYKDTNALGKPTKEVIDETEEILAVSSIIDRAGLKQLTGALKDIKEIQVTLEAVRGNSADGEPDALSGSLEKLARELEGDT